MNLIEEGQLIANADKLRHIPGVIVQGRYDCCTPPVSAWDLHKAVLAGQFPQYGWERNAGYAGAAEHVDGVAAHGLSAHHRRSWRMP